MNAINRQLGVVAGLLFALSSVSAYGDVIDPINAVASSSLVDAIVLPGGSDRSATNTINGNGLIATPTEANILTVKHNEVPNTPFATGGGADGGMWLTANGAFASGTTSAVISFDLGIPTTVSAIYVWNYGEVPFANTSPVDESSRGAKSVDIYNSTSLNSSLPGGGDSLIQHFNFTQANTAPQATTNVVGSANWNADYNVGVDVYTFTTPVLAQFIKLNILTSQSDPNFAGLSEVRFEGVPVPEPASLGLLVLGAAAVALFVRKARRR